MTGPQSKTIRTIFTDLELAMKFHETYERLAPDFGYETRDDTKQFDPQSKNGKLMIAVCHEVNEKVKTDISKIIDEAKPPYWSGDAETKVHAIIYKVHDSAIDQYQSNLRKAIE